MWDDTTDHGAELHGMFLQKSINARDYGHRIVFPAKDCLKNELVTVEKHHMGKTRVFTCVDTVDVLYARYVFGTILASFKKNRTRGHCQVGIDPVTEFSPLLMRLRRVSPLGHAGDYKQFDKHLLPQVIRRAFDFMYALFMTNTDEDPEAIRRMMDVAYDDFVHTVIVVDGVVYWKHRGNPSGNVLTCVVNSIVNDLMVLTTAISAMKKMPKQIAPDNYVEFIADQLDWLNLGDDLIVAVGDKLRPWFGFSVIQSKMKEIFSITMTHPSKDETTQVEEFTPLQECSFLSRTFHCEGDFMVWARLKKETIYGLLHWTSSLSVHQLTANLRMALDEALLWDNEFFDKIARVVRTADQRMNGSLLGMIVLPSYYHKRTIIENKVRTGAGMPARFSVKIDCQSPKTPVYVKINSISSSVSDKVHYD